MAGKRSESRVRKQLRTRHTAVPNTSDSAQSHILSRITLVICTTLHIGSLVVDRSSDDCWVCQAIVPPTTRPHRHQNSPGDRSSASQEYLHLSSQNKHPSVHPTATTTPPAYRTPHCETSQRHSFRKNIAQGPTFSLPSHNPLASQHVETASVSRRWPFELKSWSPAIAPLRHPTVITEALL